MIQPPDTKESRPIALHDGRVSTTTEVWEMLSASFAGDLSRVKALLDRSPGLLTCMYDYTSPLHLAVREGHVELVTFLVECGAFDPAYRNHPFLDPLVTIAEDRGFDDISRILHATPTMHEWGDTGAIDFAKDEIQTRFEQLISDREHSEVEAMLKERPELARDETAFWGEGVMAVPANNADRRMLEILLNYGARVPEVSKWGARYYFKHYDIAEFLLENGMNPNHMNWREFTLLHDMAHTSDVPKARLLIDHGAEINYVDDEYRSTPLGYAARWGHVEMAILLMDSGADPNKSGASWSTPLAWARKKNHTQVEKLLLEAGAK